LRLRALFQTLNFALLLPVFRGRASNLSVDTHTVHVYRYVLRKGQPRQETITGQPERTTEHDSQNGTSPTGQAGQDKQNRTARTRQPKQESQNRTAGTGQPEQDKQNRTSRTGQAEQGCQEGCLDRTANQNC
jgi:hypothetical protein